MSGKCYQADTDNQTTIGSANRGFAGDALFTLSDLLGTTGLIETRTTNQATRITEYQEELQELEIRMQSVYDDI